MLRIRLTTALRAFAPVAMCGLMTLAALLADAAAQNPGALPEPSRIMFLHLRATANGFELISAKTAPGILRVPPYNAERQGLHIELSSGDRKLFRDVHPEPGSRRLEYEDPDHAGRVMAKQVPTGSSEFTIRVPYFPEARTVRFYRPSTIAMGVTPISAKQKLVLEGEVTIPSSIR